MSPLPLVIINARGDEYIPLPVSEQLFSAAREPKKLSLIDANNHRFDGKQDDFFQALREGIEWFAQQGR